METVIAFIIFGMVILTLVVYVLLMFIYPEWVGIAGKVAKEIESAHHEEGNKEPPKEPKL